MNKFNLSEKVKTAFDVDNNNWKDSELLIHAEDVKEFIRLLKEHLSPYDHQNIKKIINALAGKDLL